VSMAEADSLELQLLRTQNKDGGWPYKNGSSWTEPTAFALLALQARSSASEACAAGCAWLNHCQRPDGAWAPHPSIDSGTWVTSLAVLALSQGELSQAKFELAIAWLTSQIKDHTTLLERIVRRVNHIPASENTAGGSPWYPGTASWVGPTALSALALNAAASKQNDQRLQTFVSHAKEYLLSRRCIDGGWNHGGTSYRSENAGSYPEMTGMALLALGGVPDAQLTASLDRAENFLVGARSLEALSWLQLGLMRHGRSRLDLDVQSPAWTTRDVALRLLAISATSSSNRLLAPVC